jgi:hypothetical protein
MPNLIDDFMAYIRFDPELYFSGKKFDRRLVSYDFGGFDIFLFGSAMWFIQAALIIGLALLASVPVPFFQQIPFYIVIGLLVYISSGVLSRKPARLSIVLLLALLATIGTLFFQAYILSTFYGVMLLSFSLPFFNGFDKFHSR